MNVLSVTIEVVKRLGDKATIDDVASAPESAYAHTEQTEQERKVNAENTQQILAYKLEPSKQENGKKTMEDVEREVMESSPHPEAGESVGSDRSLINDQGKIQENRFKDTVVKLEEEVPTLTVYDRDRMRRCPSLHSVKKPRFFSHNLAFFPKYSRGY